MNRLAFNAISLVCHYLKVEYCNKCLGRLRGEKGEDNE